ncbi:MAG TPA: hypothetical protein VGB17_18855 [Pyrinomonadaceae bacterium]|jgi:hypothetical protein
MDFRFQLAIYNREGGPRHMPVADYLQARADAAISWKPDMEDSTFIFEREDVIYIAPDWNLGRLEWLLPQMEAAAARLERGEMALIRSAVIEGSEVPYISLEPAAEEISVSLFIIPDARLERIFPAGPWSEESALLYDYFQQHRAAILYRITDPYLLSLLGHEYFSDVKAPAQQMIASLRREAEAGQKLLELLAQ